MVEERLTDGRRIAELLASELDGLEGIFARVTVTDPDHDVTPTPDGAYAYTVTIGEESDGEEPRTLATVAVHPERAHVEFERGQGVAADVGEEQGLRVRPKAVEPPRTLVFVEDGGEVKRAVAVFEAVVRDVENGS